MLEDKSYYVKQQKEKNPERFYVYIHRRLSDNKPFYVGKGSGDRAWHHKTRNAFWENTSNKHGYIVEIVFDNLDETTAFQCEKDTILEFQYFGFNLTNLTHGGEGASGYKYEGQQLERLQNHIKQQSLKQSDPNAYKFYSLSGEIFVGTRVDFAREFQISSGQVAKLFMQRGRRNVVKNWSLSPLKIEVKIKKTPLVCPQRRSNNVDKNTYTFYHITGEKFTGTRTEFSDYSQIPLVRLAGLFCKNPRKSVYGWALSQLDPSTYTHIKI